MSTPVTFSEYISSLGAITPHVSPLNKTPHTEDIRSLTQDLEKMGEVNRETVASWVVQYPTGVPVLGLAVGLSQEKLKNALKNRFDSSGWVTLARNSPANADRLA